MAVIRLVPAAGFYVQVKNYFDLIPLLAKHRARISGRRTLKTDAKKLPDP